MVQASIVSTLSLIPLVAGPLPDANAASSVTYSASFTQSTQASSTAKTGWTTFLNSLTGYYYAIEILSTNGNSISVQDPVKVSQIASRLNGWSSNSTYTTWTIGSNTVSIGNCGAGVELTIGPGASNCGCPASSYYTVRPLIGDGNSNWGGANSNTCNGASQTLTVRFVANLIENGEFSNGTNSWNSALGWNVNCAGDSSGGNLPCVRSSDNLLLGGFTGSDITQTVSNLNPSNLSAYDFNIKIATNQGNFSDQWYVGINFRDSSSQTIASLRYPSSGFATSSHGYTTYNLNLNSSEPNFSSIRSAVITFYGRDTGWGGNYGPAVDYIQLIPLSASSSSVSTPSPPTSLSATAGNGEATISFTAGSNGGSAITNYKYSIDGSTYTALSPADATSPITIPSLTNGTAYTIYLKAVNAAGDSSASSSVSVTPRTTPSPPTSLSATAGNDTQNMVFIAQPLA